MGGTAALVVAARQPVDPVITLSAPLEFKGLSAKSSLASVKAPKLFIGAEKDAGGPAARELFSLAVEPKQLLVVPGGDHGTALLSGDQRSQVEDRMASFLAETLPVNAQ